MSIGFESGILAAPPTPFDGNGDLQPDRVPDAVRYAVDRGADAVAAAATGIQETASMTVEERLTVVERAVGAAPDAVRVFAGVSHPAAGVAVDLVDGAEAAGADALVAFPPWGLGPSDEEIRDYYRTIVDAASVPVLMYNNPRIATDMSPALMTSVASMDGVEYVKETSRDMEKVTAVVDAIQHGGLARVFTTMDVYLITLVLGGSGVIAPPPLTKPLAALKDAYVADELGRAAAIQRRFTDFPDVEGSAYAVVKAAARIEGVDLGVPRPPLRPVSDDELPRVEAWLDDLGV